MEGLFVTWVLEWRVFVTGSGGSVCHMCWSGLIVRWVLEWRVCFHMARSRKGLFVTWVLEYRV